MSLEQANFRSKDPIIHEGSVQTVSLVENPEEELFEGCEKFFETATIIKEFDELQALLDKKMKKMEFETEILFYEENERIEEASKQNKVFNEEIPVILSQLEEYEVTLELLEAFQKTDELRLTFQDDLLQDQSFQRDEKKIRENLKSIEENDFWKTLKVLNLRRSLSFELIEQISRAYKISKAEAVYKVMKTMFRLKIDYEGWMNMSCVKGKGGDKELRFEDIIKNAEKLDLKLDETESIEMMIFGLNLLRDHCLEKLSFVCLSFCARFISNEEARRVSNCINWGDRKMTLTVDFTDCTFESEDTSLIIFSNEDLKLENLQAFKYFLKNTNATQKTVDDFSKQINSRMKSLERLGFDFCNLPITVDSAFETILNQASGIKKLDFAVQKTAFGDFELVYLSEEVLPKLKGLIELKLWLDQTLVTDKGLLSLCKSVKENKIAHNLTAFILGLNENKVSDVSIGELALTVMPLMENLEEFRLLVEKTLVTDKSMVLVGQNINYFAPKLKIFGMEVAYTAVTDDAISALALPCTTMKKIEYWNMWFCDTKITDQGLIRLFSAIDTPEAFSEIARFELDCSETKVTDESLIFFAQKALLKMTKLKKLVLYANKTTLEDLKLVSFFQSLPAGISDLTFSFDDTEVGERCIFALAGALSKMINLETLNLWFNQTKVENPSCRFLCSSFEIFLRNLECLSLGFDNTKVTEIVMTNEMSSLKELRLWVAGTQVVDAGITPFFENLKRARETLQDLQFCFNSTMVTDQSLLAFIEENGDHLSTPGSLKSIELWLPNTNLSDDSLAPLLASFEDNVSNLNKFALSLKGTKASSWAMNVLENQVFPKMRNLQHLQLFLGQSGIPTESIISLFESMASKVRNLRRFELELSDVDNRELLLSFADTVLPNLHRVQDFKLSWKESSGAYTNQTLCLNAMKTIRNIKTFDIRPSSFSVTTGPTAASIQEIYLEFESMYDSGLEEIIESFEYQVSQVKTFGLLVKGTQVANISIKAVANICFSFMPNLESLTLNFDELEISDEAFCYMCRSFEQFARNLKFFKMNIGQTELNDVSISTLAESGIGKMINIETLNLDFYYNKRIEEQGIVTLFTQMQNCSLKLQNLSFSIPGIKISSEAAQNFSKCAFPSLTNFQLGIYETGIVDADFALLFSGGLKDNLENIKYFALGVYEEALTENALDVLSNDILPRLTNMETFRCYFANNPNTGEESFIRLNKKLQEVGDKIEFLIFRFENMGITNAGVNEFSLRTLQAMKSLKDADISFGYNKGLNDESFVNLFDGLGEVIGKMNSLQLHLQGTGLTDVGTERFKEKMVVEFLAKFKFDVSDCNISEENQNFIRQMEI